MIERRLDEERPTDDEIIDDERPSDSPRPQAAVESFSRPPFDDEEESEELEVPLISLEGGELKRVIEAVLFSLSEPITIRALSELVEVSVHEVREAVEELRFDYLDTTRAFRLEDIAGGVQILTNKTYDPWIRRLRKKQREGRLSPAALETLAVVAYKQPMNKAELEAIRGVGCGPILKTLMDRGLIHVVGRGEGLGRPLLYGTTTRFLESFGIASIRDLPQPDADDAREAASGSAASGSRAASAARAEDAGPSDLFAVGDEPVRSTTGDGEGSLSEETEGSLLDAEAAERAELAHLTENDGEDDLETEDPDTDDPEGGGEKA